MLAPEPIEPPPPGSVQRWAYDYIEARDLETKLSPPPPPRAAWAEDTEAIRIAAPGRPDALMVRSRGMATPKPAALRDPRARAQLLHTFLHHELQAAELMCRTVLAHPTTPLAFRRGLIAICQDELRHMAMYAEHLERLGFQFGEFAVNDWFWRKLPPETTPLEFVALMGLGFEGANLDHTARFARLFDDAGDGAGAELQEKVGTEEIPHVAFALHWFEAFRKQPVTFEAWQDALPPPLSPRLLRGKPVQRAARLQAGYPPAFVDALCRWTP